MAGHLDCIGLSVSTSDEFQSLISSLIDTAEWISASDGSQLATWTDPSGALLTASTDPNGAIECVTPSFAASSRLRVRPLDMPADESCRFCDLLHAEILDATDTMVYPVAAQIDDLALSRGRIRLDQPATLRVSAFAEEIEAWPDEAAYLASQGGDYKLATESAIPTGLFGQPPRSYLMLTGRVRQACQQTNGVTGLPFHWLQVETLGGTYDVLVADGDLEGTPAVGSIVQATCWVIGRILDASESGR